MQTDLLEIITSLGRGEDFEVGFFFGTEGPRCVFATTALCSLAFQAGSRL